MNNNDVGSSSNNDFITGNCKWFNVAKGWGFLTPSDGSQDVFVHQSVIQMSGFRSLGDNESVEFKASRTEKGLEATEVRSPKGGDCKGSHRRPGARQKYKKVRCYNCGEFANHLASQCTKGPLPKRCHNCKSEDHLIEDCPTLPVDKRRTKSSAADNSSAEIADDEGDGGTVDSQKYQEKIAKTRRQTPSSNKRTNNGGRKKSNGNNGN